MTAFNPRKILLSMSYRIDELADIIGANPKTISRWIDEGLEVVDKNTKPFLIMGKSAKEFIRIRNTKGQINLKLHEFYCFKCKKPRMAKRGLIEKKGTLKKAICSVCGAKMCKTFNPTKKDYKIPISPVQMSIFGSNNVNKNNDKSIT